MKKFKHLRVILGGFFGELVANCQFHVAFLPFPPPKKTLTEMHCDWSQVQFITVHMIHVSYLMIPEMTA